jgi:hypothetical protein
MPFLAGFPTRIPIITAVIVGLHFIRLACLFEVRLQDQG